MGASLDQQPAVTKEFQIGQSDGSSKTVRRSWAFSEISRSVTTLRDVRFLPRPSTRSRVDVSHRGYGLLLLKPLLESAPGGANTSSAAPPMHILQEFSTGLAFPGVPPAIERGLHFGSQTTMGSRAVRFQEKVGQALERRSLRLNIRASVASINRRTAAGKFNPAIELERSVIRRDS